MSALRMLVVWCPDWPLVSWGVPLDEPAAVVVANRVVATTPAARRFGVARGQRRREAQGRCPELAVLDRELDREARLFEPVATALDDVTPRVEVAGPGLIGFPTRGPSRFFGGDEPLAQTALDRVGSVLPARAPARVGVADGVFAARLAARSARSAQGEQRSIRILDSGASPSFLADLPITVLDMPELTDVLVRLGLTTLGGLASLAPADVVGRFGRDGRLAHRLASGQDDHPPDLREPAPELAVTWMFDPPAETSERTAYAARVLADELHEDLLSRGVVCTRVAIEAETETGERRLRLWRHQGALSAGALADRARWQLDAWIQNGRSAGPRVSGSAAGGPLSGVARLTLIPDEVVPATGHQLGLWGSRNERSRDVTRVVARLQTLLGPDSVTVPEFRGGIGPGERIRLVPAAAVDLNEERPAASSRWVSEPWPGAVPVPSPSRVHRSPVPVSVLDETLESVGVDGRGQFSHPPTWVEGPLRWEESQTRTTRHRVRQWAGPWTAEQRWWDPLTSRRRARLQVVLEDGTAHLLSLERGRWSVEATYD